VPRECRYGVLVEASTRKSFTIPFPWNPTYLTPVTAYGSDPITTPSTEPTTVRFVGS
jgi:hypothetical protein